jgi:tetratricopeptide (TPR) repeat protein
LRSWLAACGLALLLGPPAAGAAGAEAIRMNEAGIAAVGEGRYEAAAEFLARAHALAPADGVIRQNLARVRTALAHRALTGGQLRRALEGYRAALELAPDEVSALLGLGDAQLRDRDAGGAVITLRRAVGLDPGNPEGYLRLGDAHYQQGDLQAALAEWERGLELRPEDGAFRDRIRRVEREARVHGGYRSRGSQHFTAVYEGERREDLGRQLLRILERAYADVGYLLGGYPGHDVQVLFYSEADFAAATGASPEAGGFYQVLDGKIRIAMRGLQLDDPRLVPLVYHEYAHALIYFLARGNNPPRWVHEGLAVHAERLRAPEFRARALQLARAGRLPSLQAQPYVLGSVAVEALIGRHGIGAMQQLLRCLAEGRPFAEAFEETFQSDLATFQQELTALLGGS